MTDIRANGAGTNSSHNPLSLPSFVPVEAEPGQLIQLVGYNTYAEFLRDYEAEMVLRAELHLAQLARRDKDGSGKTVSGNPAAIEEEIQQSERTRALRAEASGINLPFLRLSLEIGLSLLEEKLLAYLLFLHDGVRLPSVAGEPRGEKQKNWSSARVALAVAAGRLDACLTERRILAADSRLLAGGLLSFVNTDRNEPLFDMHLSLTPETVAALLDDDITLSHFREGIRVVWPRETLAEVVLPDATLGLLTRIARFHDRYARARAQLGIDDRVRYGTGIVLLFRGPAGTGKTLAARALAGTMGRPLVVVETRNTYYQESRMSVALMEAQRQRGILFLDEFDRFGVEPGSDVEREVLGLLEKTTSIVILATNKATSFPDALERRILHRLDFNLPGTAERRAIWRRHLPIESSCSDQAIDNAARIPWLSGGHIKNAVLDALQVAVEGSSGDGEIAVRPEQLCEAAIVQFRRIERSLGGLVRFPWRDSGSAGVVPHAFRSSALADLARILPMLTRQGRDGASPPAIGLVSPDEDAMIEAAEFLAESAQLPLVVVGGSQSVSFFRDEDEERVASLLMAVRGRFVALHLAAPDTGEKAAIGSRHVHRLVGQLPALLVIGAAKAEYLQSARQRRILAVIQGAQESTVRTEQELARIAEGLGVSERTVDWATVLREAGGSAHSPEALCLLATAHAESRKAQRPATEDFLFAARLQRDAFGPHLVFGQRRKR